MGSFKFPPVSQLTVPDTFDEPSPASPSPSPSPIADAIASVPSPATNDLPSPEIAWDTPMALGGDRNSEPTGLGDSIHAVPRAMTSSPPPGQGISWSVSVVDKDGAPLFVAVQDTQEEEDMDDDEFIRKVNETLCQGREEMELYRASSEEHSSPRDESILGSLLEGLDDIRSGNIVPLSPPPPTLVSELSCNELAEGMRGIQGNGTTQTL